MNNKGKTFSSLISVFLTLSIIGVLIISGPARAVDIEFSLPYVDGEELDGEASVGDIIEFNVTIDMYTGENIPITNISIKVTEDLECVFELDGTLLSDDESCEAFTVTLNSSNYDYENDSRYGYGFGIDENGTEATINTSFGDGFGYGLSSSPLLEYTVAWNTDDFDEADYNLVFYVTAEDGSAYYKYATSSALAITLDNGGSSGGSSGGNNNQISGVVSNPSLSFGYQNLPAGSKKILLSSTAIPVYELLLTTNVALSNVNLKVTKLDTSSNAYTAGRVYKYIQVDHASVPDATINSVKMLFKLEKSWLTNNGLQSNAVKVFRYTTQWTPVTTRVLSEDATYVYYEVTSPGLSLFAIAADTPAPVVETPTQPTPVTPPPTPVTGNVVEEQQDSGSKVTDVKTTSTTRSTGSSPITRFVVATVSLIILVAILYVFYTKRRTEG